MIISSIVTLGLAGFLFALLLALLSKKLYVKEDLKVSQLLDLLPGLNCSACGFSGCRLFAEAVVRERRIFNGCLPGGEELNSKISQTFGLVGCTGTKSQVVVCRCGAESSQKKTSTEYWGPASCRAAQLTGGALDCSYGCLGFGDCLKVCPVGALSLENKKIYVDIAKCTGCGQCIKACPRKLFFLTPLAKTINLYSVACNNKEKAISVRAVCSRGCIACTICTKVAGSSYYMKDNLSYIDRAKATQEEPLQEAKDKCPTKCIFKFNV